MSTNRNEVIDIMKGIAIILVIVGHLQGIFYIHETIYSFHMPLFFTLAGYFFSPKNSIIEGIKKDARRLLIPYITVIFIILTYSIILHVILRHNFTELLQSGALLLFFFPKGVSLGGIQGPITPVWFLISLFWCKTIFRISYKYIEKPFVYILIVAIIGEFVDVDIPFGILQGITACFFYGMGYLLKERRTLVNHWYLKILIIVVWVICVIWKCTNTEGGYVLTLLGLVGALGGTYFTYLCSKEIQRIHRLSNFLQWFGINSMIVLCVHSLERHIPVWDMLHIYNNGLLLVCKIGLSCIFIVLCYRFKITRYIFKLTRE